MKPISLASLVLLLTTTAHAFIPPVNGILREVSETRKTPAFEIVLHHRVEVKPAPPFVIEEHIASDRGRLTFLWKGAGQPRALGATLEGRAYVLGGGKSIPYRSSALVRALGATSADELREALMAEGFLRRDQLVQFKPTYKPDGDPRGWDTRESYIRHPDIFLRRMHPANPVNPGAVIAIFGSVEESNRRGVFFDSHLRGVRGFEVKEGADVYTWELESLSPFGALGVFPKRMIFSHGSTSGAAPVNEELVTSDLVRVRPLKGRGLEDFRSTWRNADHSGSLSSEMEAALKTLLSYR